MPKKKDTRTPFEKRRDAAVERQMNNMAMLPNYVKFRYGKVTMPISMLRERLGWAYSAGDIDVRERTKEFLRGDT